MGLAVWGMDEAGPYQAIPQPGAHWQPVGRPARYPHEHVRHGTAKLLTLFHPATGQVRVKGVTSCPNVVLHAWLEAELSAILESLPPATMLHEDDNRAAWERWQAGLTIKPTLCDELPPLRMLLVMDNLAGHLTARFVVWLFEHGIMPLYTPLSGSWLNMTESIQRIIAGRALLVRHRLTPRRSSSGWRPLPVRGTRTQRHSSGAANANSVDNAHINVAIHSEDPELVRANQFDADSTSWSNGNIPVK